LLPDRLHLVRQVSDWGAGKAETPENRPLKLLFMACSALGVKPKLDFEKEEETIFRVTEKPAIDMEVDDTGSLAGLQAQLETQAFDVIHLSGHADIDADNHPFFIMEDETGRRHDVYPRNLFDDALRENPPKLLFLSGCRTGEVPHSQAAMSFAHLLVASYRVPNVLSWGRPVSDAQASLLETVMYHELSRGRSLPDAVQRARYELQQRYGHHWSLLRHFSSGQVLGQLVTTGQKPRMQPRRVVHAFLEQSQVKFLKEGFVGRRRQMQRSLHALKQDDTKVGVLLQGVGGAPGYENG
jgi:CHAT domain-containing protein